jgi:hypothetical protein
MSRNIRISRNWVVMRLKRQLERESYPRIEMGFIVALTGAIGFLCSFLLLLAGVDSMALRYPLALTGAYLFFLWLLTIWMRTRGQGYDDLPDLTDIGGSGDTTLPDTIGRGGEFGGGGASGSFDDPASAADADADSLSSIGDAGGSIGDMDELAIPIIAIALAIGLAIASLYVIYLAPMLFAELLFDGVLSYTLYRRLRKADSNHWIITAIGRTGWAFAATAVFLMIIGVAMAAYAPGARSIGEVVDYVDKPAEGSGP